MTWRKKQEGGRESDKERRGVCEHKIWEGRESVEAMGRGREVAAGGTKREKRKQGKREEEDGSRSSSSSSPRRSTTPVIKVTKISIFHAYSLSFISALERIIAYWMKFFSQLFLPHPAGPAIRPSVRRPKS